MAGRHQPGAGATGKRTYAILGDDRYRGALEADLAIRGIDLYERPTWFVGRCAQALIADPASQLARAIAEAGDDDAPGHTRTELLLFSILDTARLLAWLQTEDATKGRNRPPPLSPLAPATGHRYGGTDLDQETVMAMLRAVGPPRPDDQEGGTDVND